MYSTQVKDSTSTYMSKVFGWMSLGVFLTGVVAGWVSSQPDIMATLVTNWVLFIGLAVAEIALVIWLASQADSMDPTLAKVLFLVYAALNGVTMSVIFMVYTKDSIESAFFTTSFSFIALAVYGYTTKRDLGPVGAFCHMSLFGLIGVALLALFFPALAENPVLNLAGVLVFAGLTAYDVQDIKDGRRNGNSAIIGALNLYLDFVNLFLYILKMMGKKK
jgi:FtsH-binding integral membrane protein